jgi:hypothetical protein
MGSEGRAPRILNLDIIWRGVINFTPQPLYPKGENPGSHWIGWVDPRAGLDVVAKILPYRKSNPGRRPVTTLTELSRLTSWWECDWVIPAHQLMRMRLSYHGSPVDENATELSRLTSWWECDWAITAHQLMRMRLSYHGSPVDENATELSRLTSWWECDWVIPAHQLMRMRLSYPGSPVDENETLPRQWL